MITVPGQPCLQQCRDPNIEKVETDDGIVMVYSSPLVAVSEHPV